MEIFFSFPQKDAKIKNAKKSTIPKAHRSLKMVLVNARSGARTLDTLIKSQVLYQLS